MRIKSIKIHDFRAFQEPFELSLGKYITAIAGLNGIGKSTILAILANGSEIKPSEGKLLNGNNFRGDFSDVIMFDEKNDTTGDKVIIDFDEVPPTIAHNNSGKLAVIYRAAIQSDSFQRAYYRKNSSGTYDKKEKTIKKQRYRLIPKREKGGWNTSSKVPWPAYYMGLSRIYPVGEAKSAVPKKIDPAISKAIIRSHEMILSEDFSNIDATIEGLSIGRQFNEKTGVVTNNYGAIANSSGQDNVGQILEAVVSFRELKKHMNAQYRGGLLAIDEIEATLHPAAQIKLLDYLLSAAEELDLQIVFTTHSFTLLNHINELEKSGGKQIDDLKTVFLHVGSDKPGKVQQRINPVPDYYRHTLSETVDLSQYFSSNIQALLEDDTARWFLQLIIKNSRFSDLEKLKMIPDVSISWSHIVQLKAAAADQLRNIIVILDPDINSTEGRQKLDSLIKKTMLPDDVNNPNGALFTLPGKDSIEKMLADFLYSLPSDDQFFEIPDVLNRGLNYNELRKMTPDLLFEKEKAPYKRWFTKFHCIMDPLAKRWITDKSHTDAIQKFCKNLNQAVNRLNALLTRD